MKILIISLFFPPQNSIASLRPYSWAKYWSRAGHDVTVVTLPKTEASSDSEASFEGFRVIEVGAPLMQWLRRVPHENKYKKINKKIGLIADVKFKIKKFRNRIQSYYGIFYGCRMPDALDFFWSGAVVKALNNEKWDLVVSTAGPYGVHAPAYFLRKNGLAKHWIADWRDLWTDNHIYPGLPGFRLIERLLEKKWCNSADVVTTVSDPLMEILRKKYGEKSQVIFNGFDEDDYKNLPVGSIFPCDGVFSIVYTGSIYPGRQDSTPLFHAIAELHHEGFITPNSLQVLFCGVNSNVNELARNAGIESYVKYLGFLPRVEALRLQRDASALLLLDFDSEGVKGILTGKVFEYLFAGPPIIAIGVGGESSIGELLSNTAAGKAFGKDLIPIKNYLKNLIHNPGLQSRSRENNSKILKYSRGNQARRMLELVNSNDQ